MREINCYFPITLRITGRPSDAQLDQLGDALARTLAARISFAKRTITFGNSDRSWSDDVERIREARNSSREDLGGARYRVPSYQNRGTPVNLPVTGQVPPQTFANLWREFEAQRWNFRDTEALALAPDLIRLMSFEDALYHSIDLAFWLMDKGEWSLAQESLRKLEDGWWLRYIQENGPGLPGALGMGSPRQLVDRAKDEARAARHEQAFILFGMAFLLAQMQLNEASRRREQRLAADGAIIGTQIENAILLPLNINRGFIYSELGALIDLLREILGFYLSLEQEAMAAGTQDLAARYSGLGLLLKTELRDRYTLRGTRAITMELTRTTATRGGSGYVIHGTQGVEEIVTPLPGTPTPEQLGPLPTYTSTMEELLESISGQEEFIASLYGYPEIRAEFGSRTINMNSLSDRLRVWGIMYRRYKREDIGFGALHSLLRLMEQYLKYFTRHTEYNIRDFGVSYFSTEFPQDLAGRAMRDCGVYALMVAYEVYRTARSATPRLPVDFQLYSMPEHVTLVIFDREQDTYYVVNNNRIEGPGRGNVGETLGKAYSATFHRQYAVTPVARVELGSTGMGQQAFRNTAWQRFLASTQWGLTPEPPTGPDDPRSEEDRIQAIYQRYYEAVSHFDRGSQMLQNRLDALTRSLVNASNSARGALLMEQLPDLTGLGTELAAIFDTFGPHANLSVSNAQVLALLNRDTLYTFTSGQNHPLVRLAMAFLHFESLGNALTDEQQNLLRWFHSITRFRGDLDRYTGMGRPPAF